MFVYYKCYISIELTFTKELMVMKQANVTTGIYLITSLSFNQMLAVDP